MFVEELRDLLRALEEALERLAAARVDDEEAVVLGALFAEFERVGAAGAALAGRLGRPAGVGAPGAGEEPVGAPAGGAGGGGAEGVGGDEPGGWEPDGGDPFTPVPSGARGAAGAAGAGQSAWSASAALSGAGAAGGAPPGGPGAGAAANWWPGGAEPSECFAHEHRFLRVCPDARGGVRGSFWLTERDWGRLAGPLEAHAERRLGAARSSGYFQAKEQYLADALVELCLGAPGSAAGRPGASAPSPGAPGTPASSTEPGPGPLGCAVANCDEPGVLVPPRGGCGTEGMEQVPVCGLHQDLMTYRGWHFHRRSGRWEWSSPSHCLGVPAGRPGDDGPGTGGHDLRTDGPEVRRPARE